MMQRRYFIKIACPLKLLGCKSKTPRNVDKYTSLRTKGRCKSCLVMSKSLAKVRQIFGDIKTRQQRSGWQQKTQLQILISCPKNFIGCLAKKPRWSWFYIAKKNKGDCMCCSKFKGGWTDCNGYKTP